MSDFWKTGFKPADFIFDVTIEGHQGCDPEPRHLAAKANAILFAELEKAPNVYACQLYSKRVNSELPKGWDRTDFEPSPVDTHRAKLVAIEELE